MNGILFILLMSIPVYTVPEHIRNIELNIKHQYYTVYNKHDFKNIHDLSKYLTRNEVLKGSLVVDLARGKVYGIKQSPAVNENNEVIGYVFEFVEDKEEKKDD